MAAKALIGYVNNWHAVACLRGFRHCSLPSILSVHPNDAGVFCYSVSKMSTIRHYPRCCLLHSSNLKILRSSVTNCDCVQLNICRISLMYAFRQRFYATKVREELQYSDDVVKNYLNQLHTEFEKYVHRSKSGSSDTQRASLPFDNHQLGELEPIVAQLKSHEHKTADIKELEKIIADSKNDDEVVKMAHGEIHQLRLQLERLDIEICERLLPNEFDDDSDIILEVTAGVGGQEAMLFTKQVLEMYLNYATFKGWTSLVISQEDAQLGGVRHATVSVSGRGVYKHMKFEGGVHRVQRMPQTERSGRVHTSTMAVAVLPQPKEVEIYLNAKDLRIETCRASGKGGQHVNTTDSAVRVVHIPTGLTAECQTTRSQIKNREAAIKILSSRLYEREHEKTVKQQFATRKLQVGSASRNEKIRTYNAKDDRVTDHRLKESVFNVSSFLLGGAALDALIETLQTEARTELLAERLSHCLLLLRGAPLTS